MPSPETTDHLIEADDCLELAMELVGQFPETRDLTPGSKLTLHGGNAIDSIGDYIKAARQHLKDARNAQP